MSVIKYFFYFKTDHHCTKRSFCCMSSRPDNKSRHARTRRDNFALWPLEWNSSAERNMLQAASLHSLPRSRSQLRGCDATTRQSVYVQHLEISFFVAHALQTVMNKKRPLIHAASAFCRLCARNEIRPKLIMCRVRARTKSGGSGQESLIFLHYLKWCA